MKFTKDFLLDLAERSVSTFVQAFVAVILVQGGFEREALFAGAVAGGLAVLKALAASLVDAESGASLLSSDTVKLDNSTV